MVGRNPWKVVPCTNLQVPQDPPNNNLLRLQHIDDGVVADDVGQPVCTEAVAASV